MLDARQQVRNRLVVSAAGGVAKYYFVRVFKAKTDGVAILQFAAFDFFAVNNRPPRWPRSSK